MLASEWIVIWKRVRPTAPVQNHQSETTVLDRQGTQQQRPESPMVTPPTGFSLKAWTYTRVDWQLCPNFKFAVDVWSGSLPVSLSVCLTWRLTSNTCNLHWWVVEMSKVMVIVSCTCICAKCRKLSFHTQSIPCWQWLSKPKYALDIYWRLFQMW